MAVTTVRSSFHVAVNTRLLLPRREGIGNYAHHVLRQMTTAHPEVQFTFFFDRPYAGEYVYGPNVRPVVLPPPSRHPVLWWIWFEVSVARALRKLRPDVFFSPESYLPLRSDVPSLVVFHDIAYEHYHEDLPRSVRWYYRRYFPRYAQKAERIACVSEYSRRDLAATYAIDARKTFVAYGAPAPDLAPLSPLEQEAARRRWTGGAPYFIYVGALHGRKNIAGLLRAFDRFKLQTSLPHRLLITGRPMWPNSTIENTYRSMQHRDAVVFTGWLNGEAVGKALGAAEALVLVSHFEGFGLPIAEAQQVRTPVITSNVTSMPEVAGDGALLVSPDRPDEIAAAMEKVLDPEVRRTLIEKGARNVRRFSWEQTAERLWRALIDIAS